MIRMRAALCFAAPMWLRIRIWCSRASLPRVWLSLPDPCGADACPADAVAGSLPQNLGEAIAAFKDSAFMRRVLGERTHGFLLSAKTEEWQRYQSHVDAWERDRLLAVL